MPNQGCLTAQTSPYTSTTLHHPDMSPRPHASTTDAAFYATTPPCMPGLVGHQTRSDSRLRSRLRSTLSRPYGAAKPGYYLIIGMPKVPLSRGRHAPMCRRVCVAPTCRPMHVMAANPKPTAHPNAHVSAGGLQEREATLPVITDPFRQGISSSALP